MEIIKGQRLIVNLGASQARRRLKGHGLGVRKVESAGKNRAVIIHTATGGHLRELESLFHDVSKREQNDDLRKNDTLAMIATNETIYQLKITRLPGFIKPGIKRSI